MAVSINSVTLSGNVVRDARVSTSASGFSAATFTLAVDERRRDKEGNYTDAASFIDCEILGERAAGVGPKLARGTRVCVSGRLKAESFEGKDGKPRKAVKVVVEKVDFLARPVPEDTSYLDEDVVF